MWDTGSDIFCLTQARNGQWSVRAGAVIAAGKTRLWVDLGSRQGWVARADAFASKSEAGNEASRRNQKLRAEPCGSG